MRRVRVKVSLASSVLLAVGCATKPGSEPKSAAAAGAAGGGEPAVVSIAAEPPSSAPPLVPATPTAGVLDARPAPCRPADWSPRSLAPLLVPGKTPNPAHADRMSTDTRAFEAACGDFPSAPPNDPVPAYARDGVEVRLKRAAPSGTSGRGWQGNQCTFEVLLADGSGRPVELGPDVVPPFNSITALAATGSAAWLELSFNGYTREFPKGGNRVVAVDLCEGRVVWTSNDGTSNGGILSFGDYLVTAFGFTSERRFVHVLDARSGASIQKLPVVENVCPSKVWAPNWDGGRCDTPGQLVGAATRPRIEGGLFLVDTNTGSSAFQVK